MDTNLSLSMTMITFTTMLRIWPLTTQLLLPITI